MSNGFKACFGLAVVEKFKLMYTKEDKQYENIYTFRFCNRMIRKQREKESVGDIILQLYICNFCPSAEKQNVQCPELRLYRISSGDNF